MNLAALLFALTTVTGAGEVTTLSRHDTAQSCIEARIEVASHKLKGLDLYCKYNTYEPVRGLSYEIVPLSEYMRLVKLNMDDQK